MGAGECAARAAVPHSDKVRRGRRGALSASRFMQKSGGPIPASDSSDTKPGGLSGRDRHAIGRAPTVPGLGRGYDGFTPGSL